MEQILTISKNPKLPVGQDYERLRQAGIKYLESLGTQTWTDFNTHDPGISIMEVLCYALTDLSYRSKFKIKDLIASRDSDGSEELFSARSILHNGPLTMTDYRKLLIDIEGVNNAWLDPNVPKLEQDIFADCLEDRLTYDQTDHPVLLRGLYDVFLEFSPDDQFSDLNDNKLFFIFPSGDLLNLKVSLAFPKWEDVEASFFTLPITSISLNQLTPDSAGERWLIDFEVELDSGTETIAFNEVDLVFVDKPNDFDPLITDLQNWLDTELTRTDDNSIMGAFQLRLQLIKSIVDESLKRLHANRNLCEDFFSLSSIGVEDVGFCADISLLPEADIETVLARIYFEIEKYFQPSVKFYSLEELLDAKKSTDDIFEGPPLEHGFIDTDELKNTDLRSEVRVSDLINLIMDIPGVATVENVQLTKYTDDGLPILPSEDWCLSISPNHKPRLNIDKSKVLFFKSGLPFLANEQETLDTLRFLKAVEEKAKIKGGNLDLPFPSGTFVDVQDYTSVQHDFPTAYGLGYNELAPSSTSTVRLAQNKQLKAFLLFFDQILGNYLALLSEAKNLFSFKKDLRQTYFAQFVKDFADTSSIYREEVDPADPEHPFFTLERVFSQGATAASEGHQKTWSSLIENEDIFYDRRNRFLDHLMARFSEQFTAYTLLLFDVEGKAKDKLELIDDKRAFLKDYPIISSQRAKAFDYTGLRPVAMPPPDFEPDIWDTDNVSGLQKRLSRLLGIDYFLRRNVCQTEIVIDPTEPNAKFKINNTDTGTTLLSTPQGVTFATDDEAREAAEKVVELAKDRANYDLRTTVSDTYWFVIMDEEGNQVARRFQYFTTTEERDAAIEEILFLLDDERIFLFEHILLRPKRAGDRLMTVCLDEDCEFCGEEDPYSFRITLVLPSWPSRFWNIDFRRFVERTARLETPAHIALKICWPGKEQFMQLQQAYKAWLLDQYNDDEDQDPTLLADLIDILEALRTVYPEAKLHDCEDGNDDNPILLNQTILGTSKAKEDEGNNS